jgi:dTDP-4-dehydrorhamnose reductase
MRLVVTGVRGLLGLNLALEASGSHDVIGVDRSPLASGPFGFIQADLTSPGTVSGILEQAQPDAVVHCAAAADVDFCEANPGVARQLNTELPRELAEACAARNIRLLHISTDAVFDGQKDGPYSETDTPHPRGVYATTKHAAEDLVQTADPAAIVARVNFYGWSISGTRSLAEFFVNNLKAGRAVWGFTDVKFCPMLVNQLADMLLKMLTLDLHGLFHVVGPQSMSKFDFGRAIARRFGFNEGLITPKSVDESGLAATRSHNLNLSVHRISTTLHQALPDFSTGLDLFYAQYKKSYPQKLQGYLQAAAAAAQAPPGLAGRTAGEGR